jgi:Serine dehydrogenase proteinase
MTDSPREPGQAPPTPQRPQTQHGAPAAALQDSDRSDRVGLIRDLRQKRESDVLIAHVTSTRPGVAAQMGQDAIRRFVGLLPQERVGKIDLFLHSNGGDGIVPWRLLTLLREYAEAVDVLVPHHAFSAATLACLGSNTIVMHPMGMLGPIDPTVSDPYGDPDPQSGQPRGISVEDVAAYIALVKEDVGIRHEDELVQAFSKLADKVHPLTLGSAKRGTAQARMLGEKLLRLRDPKMEPHRISTLIEELTTKLYYHGHPIGRREAKFDLELHVEEPSPEVEEAMWELYLAYERELSMDRLFDPLAGALASPGFTLAPPPPPNMPTPPTWSVTTLPPLRLAVVEGEEHGDFFEQDLRVAAAPAPDGGIAANVSIVRSEWVGES